MADATKIIDSHQHYWDLDKFEYPWMEGLDVLKRNYTPEDLVPQLKTAGVDATVVVQAQHNIEESRWILSMADRESRIAGVVGWMDLCSDKLEEQIAELKPIEKYVGVRHVVHDEPDERWLLRDDVIRGLQTLAKHDIPYDLLLRPPHLKHIPELADKIPDLRMVVDHLAKPLIASGELEPWKADFERVAKIPQICCKVSGMITEADHENWKQPDLVPYIDVALDCFGPRRLMYGSDWPVCRLAGEYSQVIDAARKSLEQLSEAESACVFGGTAIEFYGLTIG